MTININQAILDKNELTIGEMLLLIAATHRVDIKASIESLLNKGLIGKRLDMFNPDNDSYFTSKKGDSMLVNVILDSDEKVPKEDTVRELAMKLKDIYPKGKNPRCNMYWADGVELITRRLRTFFKKYGNINDEDVIFATQAYVDSFNGDYTYMQLLKYFIFKDAKGADGDVEYKSELLNIVEHKDEILQQRAEGMGYDWKSSFC